MKPSKKTIQWIMGSICAIGMGVFCALILWIWNLDATWSPLIEPRIRERQDRGSIRVLGQDMLGEEKWVGSLTAGRLEERQPLKLSDVPPQLVQAIVVLEDPRFLEHGGFDVIGILRAMVVNLVKLRYAQGGSTLTQQLVKNIFLSNERTLKRKVTELVLAALVEKRFTKDEILEAYFNEVYLGQFGGIEIHGVARASQYYFNKSVDQLEIDEMALLAAMIAGPGYYSPFRYPERTQARRDRVLRQLFQANFILETEFETALKKAMPRSPLQTLAATKAAYLLDALKEELIEERGEAAVVRGGFDVTLSLDLDLQSMAEAVLLKKSKEWPLEQQALIVAANPKTCEIKAYVGGTNYSLTQLDRIRQSQRPIGSLMKPLELIRLLDIDTNLSLASVLEDEPLEWVFDNGRQTWKPGNYDRKFRGPVTLRQSLEESLNVPITRIFYDREPSGLLGPMLEPVRALGLSIPPERALPSAVLGAVDQKPRDVLLAFVKLARQALGLAQNAGDLECRLSFESKPTPAIVEKEDSEAYQQRGARLVVSALEGALRRGTSKVLGARLPLNQAWAGKTGTSSDKRDAWYASLSPDLVLIAWAGRDDNKITDFTGASGALPLVSPLIESVSKRPVNEAGFGWPNAPELSWKVVVDGRGCEPGFLTNLKSLHTMSAPVTQNGLPETRVINDTPLSFELMREDQSLANCE